MSILEGSRGVAALRVKARRLVRQLRATDPKDAASAWERFRALKTLSNETEADFAAARTRVRLKHALAVIAMENGYPSWTKLKSTFMAVAVEQELWYPKGMDVFLNRWFAHYDEAHEALRAEGGFLFPYRNHFFICEAEAVRLLGLDPADPDWARVNQDCARPADPEAFSRLKAKRQARLS